ncbi:unnamed protein product [Toxocara canis]|uniref:Aminotran_1_2 domain-containing protein n=1 Tax=Toxocara canis TaxID=6265 RepID=A0A183VAU3_TOXCA|nr:unnamed protein product [Toxocara canis]
MGGKQQAVGWWRSAYEEDVWGEPPWYIVVLIRFNYLVMVTMAIIAEWLRSYHLIRCPGAEEREVQKSFVPLDDPFVTLYVNNLYRMGSDVVNRPLAGPPDAIMKIRERATHDFGWSYQFTGAVQEAINMGSYNYLGFSGSASGCAEIVVDMMRTNGIGLCGTRHEFGISSVSE